MTFITNKYDRRCEIKSVHLDLVLFYLFILQVKFRHEYLQPYIVQSQLGHVWELQSNNSGGSCIVSLRIPFEKGCHQLNCRVFKKTDTVGVVQFKTAKNYLSKQGENLTHGEGQKREEAGGREKVKICYFLRCRMFCELFTVEPLMSPFSYSSDKGTPQCIKKIMHHKAACQILQS